MDNVKKRAGSLGLVVAFALACLLPMPIAAWAEEPESLGEAPSLPAAGAYDADGERAGVLSAQHLAPAAASQSAATRTEAEIRTFVEAHPFNMSEAATYAEAPSTTAPYAAGRLSADSEQQALNALNTMRYIAGIPADVAIDADYRSRAQAGALVNAANNSLEHEPAQPSGMDDTLYQLGYSGDSSSNIASGYSNPAASVLGYMNDFGSNNYGVAGHRVWLLDYTMGKTGFGQAGRYGATYVFDRSRTASYTDIAWPARVMPTCLFDKTAAWSFLADRGTFANVGNLKVTLARNRGGKTWTFANPTDASDSSSDFFATSGYTGTNARYQKVLFYPSDIDAIRDGDVYSVEISDGATTKRYTVSFFDLYKPDSMTVYDGSGNEVEPGQTFEAEVGTAGKSFYAMPSFSSRALPDDDGLKDLATRTLSNYDVSWSSSNGNVASVDEGERAYSVYRQGEWLPVRSKTTVGFRGVGTASVTAASSAGAFGTFNVKVNARDIRGAVVSGIGPQVYDGTRKEPVPTVSYDGVELASGTDYLLRYGENVNVGEGTVTVVGRGNYAGEKSIAFSIAAASDGSDDALSDGSGQSQQSEAGAIASDGAAQLRHGDGSASTDAVGASADGGAVGISMHRLYNGWSGEHFYTADDAEAAGLVDLGWTDEGEGWKAPVTSNTPVYRLYNPYAGEHHYTMDAAERDSMVDAGWTYEDVGWYSDDAQTVPLFREYNPFEFSNNHNYTTDAAEHDFLLSIGWVDEGYAWYGV